MEAPYLTLTIEGCGYVLTWEDLDVAAGMAECRRVRLQKLAQPNVHTISQVAGSPPQCDCIGYRRSHWPKACRHTNALTHPNVALLAPVPAARATA